MCGIGYHACDSCSKEKNVTPWRSLTDTVEHYKIFMVLRDYKNKLISRAKAKEFLSELDLSDKDNYKDNVKSVLADINTVEQAITAETKMPTQQISKDIKTKKN